MPEKQNNALFKDSITELEKIVQQLEPHNNFDDLSEDDKKRLSNEQKKLHETLQKNQSIPKQNGK